MLKRMHSINIIQHSYGGELQRRTFASALADCKCLALLIQNVRLAFVLNSLCCIRRYLRPFLCGYFNLPDVCTAARKDWPCFFSSPVTHHLLPAGFCVLPLVCTQQPFDSGQRTLSVRKLVSRKQKNQCDDTHRSQVHLLKSPLTMLPA